MFTTLRKDNRGFTLVELMMVIVILGVLAGVAVPLIGNMQEKALVAKFSTVEDTIATTILLKATEDGALPATLAGTELNVSLPEGVTYSSNATTNPAAGDYLVLYTMATDSKSFTLKTLKHNAASGATAGTDITDTLRTFTFSK